MHNRRFLIVALICLAIAALCLVGMTQDKPPALFRGLQYGYVFGNGVDIGLTFVAVNHLGMRELNPFSRAYLNSPFFATACTAALSAGFVWATSALWKGNKTVAWIVAGAGVMIKGYVVWRNFAELNRK